MDIVKFTMDRVEPDGSTFRDRAFANIYALDFENDISEFNFDESEVLGVVKLNAKETIELLENEKGSIKGTVITNENGLNIPRYEEIEFSRFLVNPGETAIEKYGDVLRKVVELTK